MSSGRSPARDDDATAREVRIGVFVCHCGTNIGGYVDVPAVVEYARGLPDVVYAEDNLYTCSEEGLGKIREAVAAHRLNRVIVASCTPRTHGELFMDNCEKAGINRYLFEFVNIRDQCSWVHMGEKEGATEKAKDLVRMGVARARLLESLVSTETEVVRRALVIGAGISGMTAALTIADSGFEVDLVERRPVLGGLLRGVSSVFPKGAPGDDILGRLERAVEEHPRVNVFSSCEVVEVSGSIGNFEVRVERADGEQSPEPLRVGTIITATGAEVHEPDGMFGRGEVGCVSTQYELEGVLACGRPEGVGRVVMIQCAGSRGREGITYCSRVCCMTALKNAIRLKGMSRDIDVVILFRDIVAEGVEVEALYRKARDLGVRFLRYDPERLPKVAKGAGAGAGAGAVVTFHDDLFGRDTTIDADMVVLSVPLVPAATNTKLARILKVPVGQDGFFFEAHAKLRPIDFSTDGIFLCGTSQGPKGSSESVYQAMGAAARAMIPLAVGRVKSQAITSYVDPELCIGCNLCVTVCPYGAMSKVEGKALVNELLCAGCGTCGATCPQSAITMRHFTDRQMEGQIDAAVEAGAAPAKESEPRIVGFLCNWCSYAGADLAGVSRFQYPTNLRPIRVMCSGRVDPVMILRALKAGADGVLVGGCHIGDCHYISGNQMAEKKVNMLRRLLGLIGIDPRRLRLEWVSAAEGRRFADIVTGLTGQLKEMPPLMPAGDEESRRRTVERLAVAIRELSAFRNRWLLGRKKGLLDEGNAYGEEVDERSYDDMMAQVFLEEFERSWLLHNLDAAPATVEELSEHTGIPMPRVVEHISHLWGNNQISMVGKKERSPVYKGGGGR